MKKMQTIHTLQNGAFTRTLHGTDEHIHECVIGMVNDAAGGEKRGDMLRQLLRHVEVMEESVVAGSVVGIMAANQMLLLDLLMAHHKAGIKKLPSTWGSKVDLRAVIMGQLALLLIHGNEMVKDSIREGSNSGEVQ